MIIWIDAQLSPAIAIWSNQNFADGCDQETIIAELKKGYSFVSEWNGKIRIASSAKKYVRVEARSSDGKRAYSNPVYLA